MLEIIWFVLWAVLWAVYFMLDGFDLGLGSLLPFVAKNETEKRIVYNSMGPFWDGNEVWLITAGGATFAAFPTAYAIMFNGLYSALLLLLFALIIRGVCFEFRSKGDTQQWRDLWDKMMVVGSFLPCILLGVAFANIFQGLPLDKDGIFQGGLFTLLNPYGLAGGALFLMLFLVHGALWFALKTEGELSQRAGVLASKLWAVLLVVAVAFLVWTFFQTKLFDNYLKMPVLFIIPLIAVVSLIMAKVFMLSKAWVKAWFASAGTILFVTFFGVAGLFPNLLPSSLDPAYSVTIYNSASSQLTLKIMLGIALVMVPIVIAYQIWIYMFLKDKVNEKSLDYEEAY